MGDAVDCSNVCKKLTKLGITIAQSRNGKKLRGRCPYRVDVLPEPARRVEVGINKKRRSRLITKSQYAADQPDL